MMDPELKQLLEENLNISRENNQLLLKVRSVQKWAQITRYGYWIVLIAISFGALYYIQPYLGNLINIYSGGNIDSVGSGTTGASGSLDVNNLKSLIKQLK